MSTNVLDTQKYNCRVSSVLNKDVTQCGKAFMFDGKEDTCWCSDKDSPQWVNLQWEQPASVSAFQIQFQGGFVGQDCEFIITENGQETKVVEPFYPEDINSLQTFKLSTPRTSKHIVLNFNSSSDFFGRIIIYKLNVLSSDS